MDEQIKNYVTKLDTEYDQIKTIADKLAEKLGTMLETTTNNPHGRVALAELISSYTQLKKTQVDITKLQTDIHLKNATDDITDISQNVKQLLWKVQKLQYTEEDESNETESK